MTVYVSIGLPEELVSELRPDAIMYRCLLRLTAQAWEIVDASAALVPPETGDWTNLCPSAEANFTGCEDIRLIAGFVQLRPRDGRLYLYLSAGAHFTGGEDTMWIAEPMWIAELVQFSGEVCQPSDVRRTCSFSWSFGDHGCPGVPETGDLTNVCPSADAAVQRATIACNAALSVFEKTWSGWMQLRSLQRLGPTGLR